MNSAAVDPPSPRFQRFGASRPILWLGALFLAAIVGQAAFEVVQSHRAAVAATERDLDAQARVIAEQTARAVQAIDVVLGHLAEHLQPGGRLAQVSREELHLYLKQQAEGLVQSDGIVVFNADGSVRAVSLLPPDQQPPFNFAAEEPFRRIRDSGNAALHIEASRISPGNGRWVFPIGRRLVDARGQFAGVIGAVGRVDYFQQFYRETYPDPSTRISLAHRNGTLLARHPASDAALGKPVAGLIELLPASENDPARVQRFLSPIDNVDQYIALRLVPGYPLAVGVSREAGAALAPWRKQAIATAWRTLALAALAGLLLAVVQRQFRRLDAARRSLEDSQQRYALAAAGADDGIWDWDLAHGLAYESRRARELQGLPLEPETQPLPKLQLAITVHPDDAPVREARMLAHLRGDTPAYEVEYRILRDGEYRWIHVRALCIRDAQGQATRIAGSVTDVDARRRAEEALRVSEQRFAVAVAGSDDGIWDWNYQTGMAYQSPRGRQINGMPPGNDHVPLAEWQALMLERMHPEDVPRRQAAIDAHLSGQAPAYVCEFRMRHDDGAYRWVRVHGTCYHDAEGRPVRMAGSVSDIDARKRAEEALRQSEARYELAVEGSNDGILDWDIVNDRMYASDRAMRLFGLVPDGLLRTRADWAALLMPRFHPEDIDRLTRELRGTANDPAREHEGEYRVRGSDGQYRWTRFRGRSVRDVNGRPIRWAGSVSDIHDLKQSEAALRESDERYALAMSGLRGGHWIWDVTTGGMYCSPEINEVFGLPRDYQPPSVTEFAGWQQFDRADLPPIHALMQALARGERERGDYELRVFLPDGSVRWTMTRAQRFAIADGGVRIAGVSIDITERKADDAARERLAQQLRQAQKLEAIGTLAGGIAHDFNNILAAILGYGELAQRAAAEGSAQRRHLDATLTAALRAKSLVERILAFSRSGIGERVPVPVQAVAAEALDGVAASLPTGIRLARRLEAGAVAVLGDATQLHQVLMNLCANAQQAMKGEGMLEVAVRPVTLAEPLPVSTCTLAPGDYVLLAVSDSGTGIAPQLLERIFDPFFTTKEVGVGTGLGLSLVHGIVSDLGGGIAVQSTLGQGSTFSVWLPSQPWVAAPAPVAAAPAVAPGEGQCVLLVDDEEALVRLGEELLAELGYEPVGFASSTAALRALREDPDRFDALLSDESMPDLTGSELIAEVRRLRPELPVLLMSGFVTPALLQRAQALGVAEVLAKPLGAQEIARALASLFQSQPARLET